MMVSSTFSRRMWAAWILIVFGASTIAGGQQTSGGLDVVQVRPNFYMIAGAGGNIAVQVGVDGVVLVDAGTEGASDRVLAAIKKITPLPTRYIINTGADADHVSGNARLAKAGLTIFTNALVNATVTNAMTNGGGASILAHDSILKRMSAPTGKTSAFPMCFSFPAPAQVDLSGSWASKNHEDGQERGAGPNPGDLTGI